ncbi:MAG TPA: hypothetical protein DDZ97_03540, partial [Deltaproteobacteria bacterium]|nr:hypothetical protein [Deltaproteobacteria bacterium]
KFIPFREVQAKNLWNEAGEGVSWKLISPLILMFNLVWISPESLRNRCPRREIETKFIPFREVQAKNLWNGAGEGVSRTSISP